MSKDMMPGFQLFQPDSVDGAIDLLSNAGDAGWALAGGNDSLDWFKDRVKRPETVVDLGSLDELRGIRETADGGIEIGGQGHGPARGSLVGDHEMLLNWYGRFSIGAGTINLDAKWPKR